MTRAHWEASLADGCIYATEGDTGAVSVVVARYDVSARLGNEPGLLGEEVVITITRYDIDMPVTRWYLSIAAAREVLLGLAAVLTEPTTEPAQPFRDADGPCLSCGGTGVIQTYHLPHDTCPDCQSEQS